MQIVSDLFQKSQITFLWVIDLTATLLIVKTVSHTSAQEILYR